MFNLVWPHDMFLPLVGTEICCLITAGLVNFIACSDNKMQNILMFNLSSKVKCMKNEM